MLNYAQLLQGVSQQRSPGLGYTVGSGATPVMPAQATGMMRSDMGAMVPSDLVAQGAWGGSGMAMPAGAVAVEEPGAAAAKQRMQYGMLASSLVNDLGKAAGAYIGAVPQQVPTDWMYQPIQPPQPALANFQPNMSPRVVQG